MDKVVRYLEEYSRVVIFKSFCDNQFHINATKCHVLLSTDQHVQVNVDASQIEDSLSKKLLDATIDAKLSYEKHIE